MHHPLGYVFGKMFERITGKVQSEGNERATEIRLMTYIYSAAKQFNGD